MSKIQYQWDYKTLKAIPKPEEEGIANKIMTAIFLGGFVVPALLTSPYGLYAIAVGATRHFFRKSDFNRELKRLNKRGYIALTKTEKGWVVKLLKKGRKRAKQAVFQTLTLPKQKRWDGKWRLFSFDIPEEHKNARDQLRRKLQSLGCYNIQRSLFAYPYDCQKELSVIAKHYEVEKYTLYVEAVYTDLNKELIKFFKTRTQGSK